MSAKKEVRAIDIGFGAWLELAVKHDPSAWKQLMGAILLMGCAALLPVVGLPLLIGLGLAFALAFRHAWKRACEDPPWWMREAQEQ